MPRAPAPRVGSCTCATARAESHWTLAKTVVRFVQTRQRHAEDSFRQAFSYEYAVTSSSELIYSPSAVRWKRKTMEMCRRWVIVWLAYHFRRPLVAIGDEPHLATRNVVLVTADGVRWQDISVEPTRLS